MNGRFWIAVVAAFVLSMLIGFTVHGALLHDDYAQLPNLLRTEEDAQKHFGSMLAAHVLIALGFTWIYAKGREAGKPPLAQGLRFGLAVAVLMTVPMYLIYYAVQPWPSGVVAKQIVYDVIGMMVMGAVVGMIYTGPKTSA